jgi:branched-chain amino acid transport system ATP-binding protein
VSTAAADGGAGELREPVLAVRGLVAGYAGVAVVHGVDLAVDAGEVVALLGANGAGKTTTLLAVSGLADVLGGSVEVHGVRGGGPWRLARAGVAHVPEGRALFPSLTARQTLRLAVPRRRVAAALDEATTWFPPLAPVLDRPAGALSGGEQQMLALARALVARPRVLLIDEMSLGLAPLVVEALLPVIRQAADDRGTAVVLVEQHAAAALEVADRAVVLRGGRVAAADQAATLRARPEVLAATYLGDD